MSFTHVIAQTTNYTAGGSTKSITENYSKTGNLEINISAEVVGHGTITSAKTIPGFNLETAADAQSVLFLWEQTAAQITGASAASGYLMDDGGTNVIVNLTRGEPFVWQAGNTDKWGANKLQDAMTDLQWYAHQGQTVSATGTLTARVLIESTPT
jgi:hypothetical protein|tara:strand:- start:656 stop:1120 length:465 start_codon:yes stop_codon:yes gene_type:complete